MIRETFLLVPQFSDGHLPVLILQCRVFLEIKLCFFSLPTGYSGFECHLSRLFNLTILHVEYRLCPEYPLPAAVDDGVALYQALLHDNTPPSQLIFMGDSAGGGLAFLRFNV